MTTLLHPNDIALASVIMAKAFCTEPFSIYCIPDDSQRLRVLIKHFSALMHYYQNVYGESYKSEGALKGVCVWEPPIAGGRSEYDIFTELTKVLGPFSFGRYLKIIDQLDAIRKKEMPVPHWYLALLAVDPIEQCKGIGSALLQPMLKMADVQHMSVYLWTDQPSSIAFYQKHNFKIATHFIESDSKIAFWTMQRQPMR
ncbi:MAG: GNAT family N-acetyltransferase [Pseudomonadota bacterium]